MDGSAAATRPNAGFASCYKKRGVRRPCSSCRRRRSAAKQSPVCWHRDERFSGRYAPERRLRQLLQNRVCADLVAAAEGGVRLRSSRLSVGTEMNGSAAAARPNAGVASCYNNRGVRRPCSRCRRRRPAAKQSPVSWHRDERFSGRCAPERRLRQLLQNRGVRRPCSRCRRRRPAAKQCLSVGTEMNGSAAATRPNAGFASCYKKRGVRRPCSSCRRRRPAAKQSPVS
ncbi:hypothetical protein ABH906_004527 [Pseudomonas frederiksbergensis]